MDFYRLSDLVEVTEAQDNDLVHIQSVSSGDDNKIKVSNFASKTVTDIVLAENVTVGQMVAINTSGQGVIADKSDSSKTTLAGIATETGITGASIKCQKIGLFISAAHGLTIGTQYYLGASGGYATYDQINQGEAIIPIFVPITVNNLDMNVGQEIYTAVSGNFSVGIILPWTGVNSEIPSDFRLCDYRTLSQANYPVLFGLIGHSYAKTKADADAAQTAGTFHLPDGNEMYFRMHPEETVNSIDIGTDQITITGHSFVRNGTPIKIYATTTIPAGLLANTQYYVYVVDANTISLHPTEADAVENTNKIDIISIGSGTITVSGRGCYLSDAFQGHWHENAIRREASIDGGIGGVGTLTDAGAKSIDTTISVQSPITDTVNDTPRTTNETRGNSIGVSWIIKVENLTPSGEAVSALVYDTGYILFPTGWGNKNIIVNHGLNAPLSDLLIRYFLSTDGTDANAIELNDGASRNPADASTVWGSNAIAIDNNSFRFQTATSGVQYVDATGARVPLDAETTYYWKAKVYKPNIISTYVEAPVHATYDITTAADQTVILPDANATTIERVYQRTGSGSGKVLFQVYGSQTIDGQAPSFWSLGGHQDNSIIVLYPESGNWKVRKFYDGEYVAEDQKAQGTNGGSSVSGRNTRDLNTETITASWAALATNQITLDPGIYQICSSAPCRAGNVHRLYVTNPTGPVDLLQGQNEYIINTTGSVTQAKAIGYLTITTTTTVYLSHYINTAVATSGLGIAINETGKSEIYSRISITRRK